MRHDIKRRLVCIAVCTFFCPSSGCAISGKFDDMLRTMRSINCGLSISNQKLSMLEQTNAGIDALNVRMAELGKEMEQMSGQLGTTNEKLGTMNENILEMSSRVKSMDEKLWVPQLPFRGRNQTP